MGTLFGDVAGVDNHNLIGIVDCAQTVGDHQRCAAALQFVERGLYELFALGVEC